MIFKREIEKKFVVQGDFSFHDLSRFFELFLPSAAMETGSSRDFFWTAPNVDFIRLRENTLELTVKITDKDSIVDRVEENIHVPDLETGKRWATAVFGECVGSALKKFNVYYDPSFVISLYQVEGRSELFVEVESDSLDVVNNVSEALSQLYDLRQESRSLFRIVFPEAA